MRLAGLYLRELKMDSRDEVATSSKAKPLKDKWKGEEGGFAALFGKPVKPLKDKGTYHKGNRIQQTPGVTFRRRAAEREISAEVNVLDSIASVQPVDPLDCLEYIRPGVQYGVFKNLRLGKYSIQSSLDLHGESVEQARQIINRFIVDCRLAGVRCALITHGKGEGRPKPAVLKSCVNHWLRQFPEVLAFHSATKFHGGLGATYVLLKKSDEARQRTTEKFNNPRRHNP